MPMVVLFVYHLISGIPGNLGQTDYTVCRKQVLIGVVKFACSNFDEWHYHQCGCAPGFFIETQMTAAIPFAIREAGHRMNSIEPRWFTCRCC